MDIVYTLSYIFLPTLVAVGFFISLYKLTSPSALPIARPRFTFFPKYYLALPPSGIATSDMPKKMERNGFQTIENRSGQKSFERSIRVENFKNHWHTIRVSAIEGDADHLLVEYRDGLVFDHGHLWTVANELKWSFSSQY